MIYQLVSEKILYHTSLYTRSLTKGGIDSQKAKGFIFQKTGMTSAIYDDGSHYVKNQELTLEMLKDEHLDHKHTDDYYLSQEQQQLGEQRRAAEEKKISRGLDNHKLLTYTVVGVIGVLALAGFIISGGLLPNVNRGAPPLPQTSSSSFPPILEAFIDM